MGKYDHVQARTDDDIGDEEAGRMRAQLAEESRSRKAAEAARIKKANEENRKRLAGVTARTDDGGHGQDKAQPQRAGGGRGGRAVPVFPVVPTDVAPA